MADKNSSRRSKNKGKRGEKELADIFTNNGIEAKRVPLSGALGGNNNGDIIIIKTNERAEVKRREKEIRLIEKWLEQMRESNCSFVFFREDRGSWKLIMDLEEFIKLYKKANLKD